MKELDHISQITQVLSPKIYGLPKIHEVGHPLRPMFSCVKSLTYLLFHFMAGILANIMKIFNIRSSSHLREKISDLKLPDEYIIVTIDAASLFANISISFASELIFDRRNDALDNVLFFLILNFCLDNSYLKFEGKTYTQIKGLAMGSPLSPIVANIVLGKLFEFVKHRFGNDVFL